MGERAHGCVAVTGAPEGRDKTIDFTFGRLPCREVDTSWACLCAGEKESVTEGERKRKGADRGPAFFRSGFRHF